MLNNLIIFTQYTCCMELIKLNCMAFRGFSLGCSFCPCLVLYPYFVSVSSNIDSFILAYSLVNPMLLLSLFKAPLPLPIQGSAV